MRAIAYFERALHMSPYHYGTRRILASLSSCYRQINHPEKSLALWSQYEDKYFLITPPFLTSIGAAFMDRGDIHTAKRMAGRAFALNNYYADIELSNLYRRINSA
jgi:tetratricopeptide (TPR) repeat protein